MCSKRLAVQVAKVFVLSIKLNEWQTIECVAKGTVIVHEKGECTAKGERVPKG